MKGEEVCESAFKVCDVQDRPEEYERARGKYIIDNETMKILPKKSVIMHPLPRVDEVTSTESHRTSILISHIIQKSGGKGSHTSLVCPRVISTFYHHYGMIGDK